MKQEHVIETRPTVKTRSTNKMHRSIVIHKSIGFSVKRRKGTIQTYLDAEKLLALIAVSEIQDITVLYLLYDKKDR